MAITPLTTTLKTGTKIEEGFLIAGFQSTGPPFVVQKTFRVPGQVESYKAVSATSSVSNAWQLEKLSQPGASAILKEHRTPYTHIYPVPYAGGAAVTRCENILLTYLFYDEVPLFYQWLVTDVDNTLITNASYPTAVSVTLNGEPYKNFQLLWNKGNSFSLYLDKRVPGFELTMEGVTYPVELFPVMRWIASSGSFTADSGDPKPSEFNITNGNIYINIANKAQEWAVGYAEYFDFMQKDFPIIGIDFQDWHSRWRVMCSAGSFIYKNGSNLDIFDIGSTTLGSRVLYGVEMKRVSKLVYSIGQPVRTIIEAYTQDGATVTLTRKDTSNGLVSVSSEQTETLYVDVTVFDRFAVSEYNANYNPTFDSNYFTPGLASREMTTNIYIRADKDITNDIVLSKGVAHHQTDGTLNDLTTGGTYTGNWDLNYVVEIDTDASPDKFRWSEDGGTTWDASTVIITGGSQTLSNGVTVTFGATTGHTVNDRWEWSEYTDSSNFLVTLSNELGNHLDSTGSAKEISSDYLLLAQVIFPSTRSKVTPIIYRGAIDKLFKLNDYDPREYPVANLQFGPIDTLDIEADPSTRTITIQVPDAILDHADASEVEQEIKKFIPLGTRLVVNYKP